MKNLKELVSKKYEVTVTGDQNSCKKCPVCRKQYRNYIKIYT